ncbi:MAG: ABC transporter permease [Chitinophagaceae bacterium]|nr:ABC transporter permease [Chitinophagaceae bacterium]MCW5925814.1 ABC transporter permease [Chitinophagaceae bacterium]
MNTALFIARRVAFNRQKTFSRIIIRLAVSATAISVAIMILTLAFVNGFQHAVSQKVFSFWGHIRVQYYEQYRAPFAEESPILKNDSIVAGIKEIPGIKTVQAFATKSAILKTDESIEGVLFKGVDTGYDFSSLQQFLTVGRWVGFSDSTYSREIVISEYTAKQLRLNVDDRILIYFFRGETQKLRPDRLTIVGIYKTNMEEYDKLYAIGDLKLVQRLNDWSPDEIGGYEVFVDDYKKMDALSDEIFSTLPGEWGSKTMTEIYPNIFDWLQLQNTNRDVVLVVMIVIAIINLITCLIILVLERTRMIGVLKSVGATDWVVQKIFTYQGIFIACFGILIGLAAGLGICYLQERTGFLKFWDENAYYMLVIPVQVIWWQVLLVVLGTLVVCALTLLIPSMVSRRIQPAKAVQFR